METETKEMEIAFYLCDGPLQGVTPVLVPTRYGFRTIYIRAKEIVLSEAQCRQGIDAMDHATSITRDGECLINVMTIEEKA